MSNCNLLSGGYKKQYGDTKRKHFIYESFLSMNNKRRLKKQLCEEFGFMNIPKKEINEAVNKAWKEANRVKADIRNRVKSIRIYKKDR